ncbi:C4-dicarboxylate TRAP transporter large permease protein DctM [subsurface metagenome]|nr:TRAP transporter large permease subunit [Dehalococcoidia bacterium]
MIDMSPELITVLMLGGLIVTVLSGYPLALPIGAIAVVVGYLAFGSSVAAILYAQVFSILHNYVLLALPLFIFMGVVLEYSGIADRMYDALFLILSGLRGGLAIITVLLGTVLAACVGVITASVSMLTSLSLASMVKRGYDHSIAAGAICAGGTLGILIPPSVMLVIYGPMARISVGKLFMAAMFPGLILSGLYITHVALRCFFQPKLAPAVPVAERAVPTLYKVRLLFTSALPPVIIILSVLGSIFAGIAPPTEAAAIGGFAALILTAAHRRLTWPTLKKILLRSLNLSCMVMLIGAMSVAFTGVFIKGRGAEVVQSAVLAAPGGVWGAFAAVMFMYFILGFFIEWLGIFFIMVPITAPLAPILGFDPIWFGMMICINLQMSFLTPPYAFAIFVLRGVAPPELGVTSAEIIRGVIPYIFLVMVCLGLCIAFPQIILWLPGMMIK